MESSIPFVNIISGGKTHPPVMNYGEVFVVFDHHEDCTHLQNVFSLKIHFERSRHIRREQYKMIYQ